MRKDISGQNSTKTERNTSAELLNSSHALFKSINTRHQKNNQNSLEFHLHTICRQVIQEIGNVQIQFLIHDKGVPYALSFAFPDNAKNKDNRYPLTHFNQFFKKVNGSKSPLFSHFKKDELNLNVLGYSLSHAFKLAHSTVVIICSNNSFLQFEENEINNFKEICKNLDNKLSDINNVRINKKKSETLIKLVENFPLPLMFQNNSLTLKVDIASFIADIGHHRKISLLGDLTNTLAHELSNPLFGLSLCSSTISLDDPELQSIVAEIKNASERCVSIIEHLKNIYSESQDFKQVAITELIKETCIIAKSELKQVKLNFIFSA